MKTKFTALVAAIMLLAAVLAGCAQPAAEPTVAPTQEATAAPEEEATVATEEEATAAPEEEATAAPEEEETAAPADGEKDTIVWGTNAEFMPFETKDSSGTVVGVDADIAAAIAEKLGAELVVEDMEFDSLPAALESGKIDFIAAGFTRNEEREKSMDFSDTYYVARQVVLVREDSTIASEDDLKGLKIGVQNGTTGDLYFASEIEDADVQRYTTIMLAAQDLAAGRIDCVIGDNLPIGVIMNQIEGLKLVESIVYEDESYAIATRKGETELMTAINEVLAEMTESGEIDELLTVYSTGE